MHVRPAKSIDVPTMGEIQAECNKTDTISRYFVHDIEKYPTSYRRGSIRFTKRQVALPGAVSLVIETEPSDYVDANGDTRAPEVVGFVIFQRIGSSVKAQEWQSKNNQGWLWAGVNKLLTDLEDAYLRTFPNVDRIFQHDRFRKILPHLSIPFDEQVFAEAWEVNLFFVDPRWQRRGLGRKLLQWGFDQAIAERVPVVVKSSAIGVAAYKSCGFTSIGEIGLKKIFDTTEFGGEEPQMLVWEPPACKGMWCQRGKEALEKVLKAREEDEKNGPQ